MLRSGQRISPMLNLNFLFKKAFSLTQSRTHIFDVQSTWEMVQFPLVVYVIPTKAALFILPRSPTKASLGNYLIKV